MHKNITMRIIFLIFSHKTKNQQNKYETEDNCAKLYNFSFHKNLDQFKYDEKNTF